MKHVFFSTLSLLCFVLSAGFSGSAFIPSVSACECHKKNNFDQEFNDSKAVFLGEVVNLDNAQPDSLVTIKIEEMWKGSLSDTILIKTDNQGKSCGFIFQTGEKYLVYAGADGESLRTSICTRTANASAAGEDLAKLAQKKPRE